MTWFVDAISLFASRIGQSVLLCVSIRGFVNDPGLGFLCVFRLAFAGFCALTGGWVLWRLFAGSRDLDLTGIQSFSILRL